MVLPCSSFRNWWLPRTKAATALFTGTIQVSSSGLNDLSLRASRSLPIMLFCLMMLLTFLDFAYLSVSVCLSVCLSLSQSVSVSLSRFLFILLSVVASLLPSLLPSFLACFLPCMLPCSLACFLACLLACLLPSFLPSFRLPKEHCLRPWWLILPLQLVSKARTAQNPPNTFLYIRASTRLRQIYKYA